VLVYRVERWTEVPATARGEIIRVDWFEPDGLPDGTTAGTRRRIQEALGGAEPSPYW
jgi:hypothetical protein